MVATPDAMPVTIPVEGPTVAIALLLLVHVPPVVSSCRVIVELTHTVEGPLIVAGVGLTVTTTKLFAVQPKVFMAMT
jgi:hypothetical protein